MSHVKKYVFMPSESVARIGAQPSVHQVQREVVSRQMDDDLSRRDIPDDAKALLYLQDLRRYILHKNELDRPLTMAIMGPEDGDDDNRRWRDINAPPDLGRSSSSGSNHSRSGSQGSQYIQRSREESPHSQNEPYEPLTPERTGNLFDDQNRPGPSSAYKSARALLPEHTRSISSAQRNSAPLQGSFERNREDLDSVRRKLFQSPNLQVPSESAGVTLEGRTYRQPDFDRMQEELERDRERSAVDLEFGPFLNLQQSRDQEQQQYEQDKKKKRPKKGHRRSTSVGSTIGSRLRESRKRSRSRSPPSRAGQVGSSGWERY